MRPRLAVPRGRLGNPQAASGRGASRGLRHRLPACADMAGPRSTRGRPPPVPAPAPPEPDATIFGPRTPGTDGRTPTRRLAASPVPTPPRRHGRGRVPAGRPRAGRLDRPVPGRGRALPGAVAGEAGRGPRRPAPGRARRRRAVERHPRRRRAHRRPRPDPLEPPRVLRLLRDQRQRPRHPRRLPERRVQRPGHAVAHLAGGDRARRGGPGLAAAPARAPRRLRGGHLRHRLHLDPARAGRGPTGGARGARARPRRAPRPPGAAHLLLRARPLVGRQGGDDAGAGPRRDCGASPPTSASACGPTPSPPPSTRTGGTG